MKTKGGSPVERKGQRDGEGAAGHRGRAERQDVTPQESPALLQRGGSNNALLPYTKYSSQCFQN